MLVACIGLVTSTGELTYHKIRLQNTADSAALAAAQVQANSISNIAWINDGMALIYYNLMRYAVDVSVLATLAEFKNFNPPAPDAVIGISDPEAKYQAAYARASEWIPRGKTWLETLNRTQRGIALITPVLAEKEIYEIIGKNGAERAAFFPEFSFFPDPDAYVEVLVDRLIDGWRLISSTQNRMILATTTGEDSWHIEEINGASTVTVDIEKTSETKYRITYDDGAIRKVIYIDRTKFGDIMVEGDGVKITQNPDGSTTIIQGGVSVDIRQGPDGMQVNYGNGWENLNRQETVDVNGATLRLTTFSGIVVGKARIWPDHITIGHTSISFSDPIRIVTHFGIVNLRVENDEAIVNGLSTRTADGLWRRRGSDRARHRLTPESANSWTYEYRKNSGYLTDEDMDRFVFTHAIKDNDAYYKRTGNLPAWTTWFDPLRGSSTDYGAYYQTINCWHPNDRECPVHGYEGETDGFWHELGTGKRMNCTICNKSNYNSGGLDHNEDGITDVRIEQRDAFYRQGDAGLDEKDYQYVDFFTNVPVGEMRRPLVLTEDFFKFGITVCVWGEASGIPALINALNLQVQTQGGLFSNPDWGHFAMASAKVGFYDSQTASYRYGFDNMMDREDWVNESYMNLYEPNWSAKLVPITEVIKSEDIDADTEDSSINYLFRSLSSTEWRADFLSSTDGTGSKLNRMLSPWSNRRFDLSGEELEDVLQH